MPMLSAQDLGSVEASPDVVGSLGGGGGNMMNGNPESVTTWLDGGSRSSYRHPFVTPPTSPFSNFLGFKAAPTMGQPVLGPDGKPIGRSVG